MRCDGLVCGYVVGLPKLSIFAAGKQIWIIFYNTRGQHTESMTKSAKEALGEMKQDPDLRLEADGLATSANSKTTLPLNAYSGAHRSNENTKTLCAAAGGLNKLREMTSAFYKKAFADPQLDAFIRSHDDPHGERFATWIAEKMGLGRPWSDERRTRKTCPFHSHGYKIDGYVFILRCIVQLLK